MPRCARGEARSDPRYGRLRPIAKAKPGRPDSSSRRIADTARRPISPSPSGRSTAISPPASSAVAAAIDTRRDRARPPRDQREHAPAPVLLGWAARVGANDHDARAHAQIGAHLLAARDRLLAALDPALEHGSLERRGGFLGGALGSPHALDLRRDQRGDQAQQRGVGRSLGGPHAQFPHRRIGHLEIDRRHIVSVAHQRALVGGAAGGDRKHRGRPVNEDQTGLERARRGAEDGGQAGAVLDGVGDRGQRGQVRRGRHRLLRTAFSQPFRSRP